MNQWGSKKVKWVRIKFFPFFSVFKYFINLGLVLGRVTIV